jgi:hypothetical protein
MLVRGSQRHRPEVLLARPAARVVSALFAATLGTLACASLIGCDQFALVGIVPDDAGPRDGGEDAFDAELPPLTDGAVVTRDGSPGCEREVAICDPVANTGCSETLQMQCAPDLSAPRLAGYCTFVGPLADGGLECLNSVVTESCPPSSTCLNNECRVLCHCDADCDVGQCCTEPLGEHGFHVCAPC